MNLKYSVTALKQLKNLSKNDQVSILKNIETIKTEPLCGKKLKGIFKNLRSFKVWPYRIIYQFSDKENLVFVNAIQHRQSVYKK
jgi:mRNA-degrading endonuclease RelE of RelBE toxin-antitoxin system